MRYAEIKGPHYTNYVFLIITSVLGMSAKLLLPSFSLPFSLQKLCLALWAGFVGGISLMEAWMKFHAESVQKYPNELKFVAFDIGRLIFWSLQRMEMVMAAILLGLQIEISTIFLTVLVMLILQVLVIQPKLDLRGITVVKAAVMEKPVPKMSAVDRIFHITYVSMEIVKFGLLLYLYTL